MATCIIALGSNLGERLVLLNEAIRRLEAEPGIHVVSRSRWYHTRPIGGPAGQGEFVNAAVRIETSLAPEALFQVLQAVERELGRQRRERWAARCVDLDVLLYEDRILQTEHLTVPHPRMTFRRFVLEPAAEIAGDLRHPGLGWTLARLLEHLNTAIPYVAVTGLPGVGKSALAQQVAALAGLRLIADPGTDPAAVPANPAAPALDEGALLRRRAARLAARTWPSGPAGAISDFWLGQSLAYARTVLGAADRQAVEDLWQALHEPAVAPKLLVLLDGPAPADRPRPAWQTRLQKVLREMVLHGGYAPALQLDADQPELARGELTAAVEAMK